MTTKRRARALVIAREEDMERFRSKLRAQGYSVTCITTLVGRKVRLGSYAIVCIGGNLATPEEALPVLPKLRLVHEAAAEPLRKAG